MRQASGLQWMLDVYYGRVLYLSSNVPFQVCCSLPCPFTLLGLIICCVGCQLVTPLDGRPDECGPKNSLSVILGL